MVSPVVVGWGTVMEARFQFAFSPANIGKVPTPCQARGHAQACWVQGSAMISTQFGFFPMGTEDRGVKRPVLASMLYTVNAWDN